MIVGETVGSGMLKSRNFRGVAFHHEDEELGATSSQRFVDDDYLTINLTDIINELQSSDPLVRARAAGRFLWNELPDTDEARKVVTRLIELLDDKDEQVRLNSIASLEQIGPRANEAIPKLIELLGENNGKGKVSTDAAQALATLLPQVVNTVEDDVVKQLENMLRDKEATPPEVAGKVKFILAEVYKSPNLKRIRKPQDIRV